MSDNINKRTAEVSRVTGETDILVKINLDGSGQADIDTGIGFFDHMLNSFARHGLFDLTVKVKGDLEVDCHHSIEDTGIVLGQAIKDVLMGMQGGKLKEVKEVVRKECGMTFYYDGRIEYLDRRN